MDLGLADATAVIVGGSRGRGLAGRGTPDALGFPADIGDATEVEKVFAETAARWNGELNVLVNTVGPGAPGTFEDLTDDQWRESVEDGVMGMVRGAPTSTSTAAQTSPDPEMLD